MSYRVRYTYRDGGSGLLGMEYTTRAEAEREIAWRENPNNCMTYTIEEVSDVSTAAVPDARPEPATPEARIRELEAELAQLRDARDEAVLDRDVAMARIANMEHLGDAMHRAMTTAQGYLAGEWGGVKVAMKEWAAYKDSLAASRQVQGAIAASRQGPAKASEAPGEGHHGGEGAK